MDNFKFEGEVQDINKKWCGVGVGVATVDVALCVRASGRVWFGKRHHAWHGWSGMVSPTQEGCKKVSERKKVGKKKKPSSLYGRRRRTHVFPI